MKPEDSLRSAESPASLPDQPLADALHRALERVGRGEPARLEELLPDDPPGRDRLAELLRAAGRLDQFVRHVEEGSGARLLPGAPGRQRPGSSVRKDARAAGRLILN